MTVFIMGACSNRNNEKNGQSKQEESYTTEISQEEDVEEDADDWLYQVVLKKPNVRPGEEYLSDGTPEFAGLTLIRPDGQYIGFNDDVDYSNFIRQFAYGLRLCREAENSSVSDWDKFTQDVLNNTRYVIYSSSSFENISSAEWKDKAKKIWYDYYKELPIVPNERKYGSHTFAYPFYVTDRSYSGRVSVTRVESNNPYDLPSDAILIK